MFATLGNIALHLVLVVTVGTVVCGVIAGRTGSVAYSRATKLGVYTAFGLMSLASTAYLHALATHNFELAAVFQYSDTRMPWIYLLAAFWGGQAGSLTFWTGMLGIFAAAAVYLHRKTEPQLIPWFAAVTMGLMAFLTFILLFASNPFETFQFADTPKEGNGLNPLLQTPLMVMHPPSLLTGYVSMAIPFAWAMAALASNRLNNEWLRPARRWALISWLFLSIGNMLGGMWAYEELGWGGYWAWDPVENAAFMPWLAATAFIHSLMVQERRGMLRRWNIVLITLAFLLTLLGTFITRSGLIDSVHTFAQSDIGDYFFALLISFTLLAAGLVALRWKGLSSKARFDSPLSREAFFLGNNWILVGMTFVVFWGTMFPKIKEMITGDKVSVGPPWFNKYMIPLTIILLIIMGIGTVIAWKKSSRRNFRNNFLWPIVGTLVATPLLCIGYWFLRADTLTAGIELVPSEVGYAIGATFLCVFVLATIVSEYYRGLAARMRSKKENILEAGLALLTRQRRRYGGYIVHAGFVLVIMAFCGNAFKVEQDVSMKVGEMVPLGDYQVRYDGLRESEDREKVLIVADVTVLNEGEEVTTLTPGRAIFHSSPDAPTSEISIDSGPMEDLYFALVGFSPDGQTASFKMVVSPLTWWFWYGATILIFGTLICLWPQAVKMPKMVYRRAAVSAAGTAAAVLLSSIPLIFWTVAGDTQTLQPPKHEHSTEAGPEVMVHDPTLSEIMDIIRVECPASGNPTMANSSPTCPDFQRDLATVREMLAAGKSKQEILDHFVELRGEQVLALPTNERGNWLSWALPLGLLVLGVPLIVLYVRRWSKKSRQEASARPGAEAGSPAAAEADDDPYREQLARELAEL